MKHTKNGANNFIFHKNHKLKGMVETPSDKTMRLQWKFDNAERICREIIIR